MTPGGWIMFLLSWTLITGLSAYCMAKVIKLPKAQAEHIHPIHEIDTGDLNGSPPKERDS